MEGCLAPFLPGFKVRASLLHFSVLRLLSHKFGPSSPERCLSGPSCLPGDGRGPAESKCVTVSATPEVVPTVMSTLLEGSRGFWGLHAGGSLSLCADSEYGFLLRRPAPPALLLVQTGRGSSELYGGNLISNGSMVTEAACPAYRAVRSPPTVPEALCNRRYRVTSEHFPSWLFSVASAQTLRIFFSFPFSMQDLRSSTRD